MVDCGAALGGASEKPHFGQNVALARTLLPQFGQDISCITNGLVVFCLMTLILSGNRPNFGCDGSLPFLAARKFDHHVPIPAIRPLIFFIAIAMLSIPFLSALIYSCSRSDFMNVR